MERKVRASLQIVTDNDDSSTSLVDNVVGRDLIEQVKFMCIQLAQRGDCSTQHPTCTCTSLSLLVKDALRKIFLTSLTSPNAFNDTTQQLTDLPVRLGGQRITDHSPDTILHHDASMNITTLLSSWNNPTSILSQNNYE